MRVIGLVELDAITVPEWARRKAIPGLTITETSVWLGRIAANALARFDRESGGEPRLTIAAYRPCKVCGRARLGEDAEARWELDRKYEGWRLPCGPECLEIAKGRECRI